jgi:hypothetical protein
MVESRKIPSPTGVILRSERQRNELTRADLHRRQRELQEQAAREFATLNSWRFTERMFDIKTLVRGGAHTAWERDEIPGRLDPHDLLDHPIYFREISRPYRPVAIVGQPYDTATSVEKGIELAHLRGLELHVPPNSVASWWYPGHTRFFCQTRPGVEVRFLPDQLTFEGGR